MLFDALAQMKGQMLAVLARRPVGGEVKSAERHLAMKSEACMARLYVADRRRSSTSVLAQFVDVF
jgi:hypothetical protein